MNSPESATASFWRSPAARWLGLLHGLFYAISGAWPVVHLPSFLVVTGPKVDTWLVQTVGALLAVTGVALTLAAQRRRLNGDWALVAGGQAASLGIVDVIFVSDDRISPIYLLDAAVEFPLAVGWLVLGVIACRRGLPPAHPGPHDPTRRS